jgi:TnpA family transposase
LCPEQRGDGLDPHAAVDGLGGQGVPQPVGVHAGHAGGTADAGDDAADDVPVQRSAVVGDQLDLIKVWGDGSVVAADGTQVDTLIDNLLAVTSIRDGGTGGIAYHYVSDTYIALFSKFIPVGVWEAVHIIQGLLDQQSSVKPDTIHADTQGQALPVYALAHLCGFELMLRVRNWKDLNFYRSTPASRFRHIDTLFGEPGRNVIDWDLIERHYDDLMRVVLSVAAGKISSVTLLRRLSTYSRRNNFYTAFREVGRVIRTIQLLRYLSDPQLRRRTTEADQPVRCLRHRRDQRHSGAVRRAPARHRPHLGPGALTRRPR